MKAWLTVLSIIVLCSPTFGQDYRVQIGAYVVKKDFDLFHERDIFGVFEKVDQNKIYRYYIGDYYSVQEADEVREELLLRGFLDARVIDLEEQRQLCGTPCPYFTSDFVYNHLGTDRLMVSSVFFSSGQMHIDGPATKTVFEFAKILKRNPNFYISLGGHSDSQGSIKTNIRVAKERVRSVVRRLERLGIDKSRMALRVFGEGMPLVDESEKPSKYNRRVVLTIVDSSDHQVVSKERATMDILAGQKDASGKSK